MQRTDNTLPERGEERTAFVRLDPVGFQIRHPPPPHELNTYITPDDSLFHTMHMGAVVVDNSRYRLVIDGHVEQPFAITLDELKDLPQTSITAFHECYGSPLKPPTEACWRIGNVRWTGVGLSYLLNLAGLKSSDKQRFVWSEGLDRGVFAEVEADRYQKDLPLEKALLPEIVVAYEMNGKALNKERGGPVRLVVPGYFGTNSTKWLCKLSVQMGRAPGPYTTTFYNERAQISTKKFIMRPIWQVAVNSMIIEPKPGEVLLESVVHVQGWAWSSDGVKEVEVRCGDGDQWQKATVTERFEHAWQSFQITLHLRPGLQRIIARATSESGEQQPLEGQRNHAHHVDVEVKALV